MLVYYRLILFGLFTNAHAAVACGYSMNRSTGLNHA